MGKQKDPAILKKVTVGLPFGLGEAVFESDETKRRAAWSLYVELVTRIAVQQRDANEGMLRDALTSLYSLFDTTREVLKEAGPDVGASNQSVGGIAIVVLNRGLRPFLSKWHPRLQDWESKRPEQVSIRDHEMHWPEAPQLRSELEQLRIELEVYAEALAKSAGVEL